MIFILKTYTTTSIEYNVIQLMFSKDMAHNLDRFQISYIYYQLFTFLRPTLVKIQYDQQNPILIGMMMALAIGNISWAITF